MANTKKYVSLDKLSLYDEKIKKVITDGDAAALASANTYAEGLASNYDAAGSAATVQGKLDEEVSRAKAEEERIAGLVSTAQGEVDALELVVAEKAAQADLDALETLVGTLPEGTTAKDVVDYVNVKTAGIATDAALSELQGQLSGVQGEVATIKGDYLKASDKTELEGKINAKADQTALDAVSGVANAAVKQSDYDTKIAALEAEDTRIAGLVTAEAERAAGVESGLDERLVEVEAFFKLAEGEQLDTALDTLKEIQTYITTEGAAADQMVLDIAANAKAIEDMDAAYKEADETLQGNIDTLSGVVNGKVAQGDFDTLAGRVTTAEGKITANEQAITALQGADTTLSGRIDALEGAIGESGSVADDIATAKQEAIDAAASAADTKDEAVLAAAKKYADEEDAKIEERVGVLETASATHALKSEVEAVAGRVTTAEGEIDTLQSEMDAVEALAAANKAAHEANAAAIALKASQADLEAVSGRVTTLETWHNNFIEVSEEEINGLFA